MTSSTIEARLAHHPLHAFYWPMIAPVLYGQLVALAAILIYPPMAAVFSGEAENAQHAQWLILTLIQFAVLIRLCHWAKKITGTPFAGEMWTSSNWIGASLLIGPIVLIGSGILVSLTFGAGDSDWAYHDDYDSSFFSQDNLGIIMIVYVLLMAPIVEEIGFRGVAIGCLLGRGVDPRLAVLVTTLGFAALHIQYTPLGLIPVFASGLFLGWLRIASGTVAVPIIAHIAANGAALWLLAAQPSV